jgi:serine/threonine protein phosphatase PrpC
LGGYRGGQIASQRVVSTVLHRFSEHPGVSQEVLSELLNSANEALLKEKSSQPSLSEMRATVVVLSLDFARGLGNWAHLGDSRLYVFRRGGLLFRTLDHSYLQHMVNQGHLDSGQVRTHPMRNLLLGALGSLEEFTPTIQNHPEPLQAGDAFLLCTDGFWQALDETDMLRTLQQVGSAEEWLSVLEDLLLNRVEKGHDNYSALAVWLGPGLGQPAAISESEGDTGDPEDPDTSEAPDWANRTLPLN